MAIDFLRKHGSFFFPDALSEAYAVAVPCKNHWQPMEFTTSFGQWMANGYWWPLEALEVWNQKTPYILQMLNTHGFPFGKWFAFMVGFPRLGVNCKPLQEGPCWTSFSETLGYAIELVKPHVCCFPCGVANPNFGWLNSNLWCRSAPASISSPASGLHADFCRPAHSAVWSPTINQKEASIFRGSWVKISLK